MGVGAEPHQKRSVCFKSRLGGDWQIRGGVVMNAFLTKIVSDFCAE